MQRNFPETHVQSKNHETASSANVPVANPAETRSGYVENFLPGAEESVDLRQVLTMLRRRRKAILGTFVAVLAAGTILTFMAKPVYQSKATLLVNTSSSRDSGASDMPLLADLIGATKARSQETQIEILKSTPVQEGALKRVARPQQASLGKFNAVNITPVRDTDVIAVSVQSHDPRAAQQYAQGICEEYIDQNLQQNQQQVLTATKYVSSQLPNVRRELDAARQALRQFKEQNNTADLTAETQARIAQLGEVQNDLRQAQADRQSNVAQLAALRDMAAKMSPNQIRPDRIVRNPQVESLKAQLTKLELARLEAIQEYSPTSSRVKNIEEQLTPIRQKLASAAQTEVGSWTNEPNPVRVQVLQDAAKAQGQVWAQEARLRALNSSVLGARAQLATLPEQEARLGQLTTEVATLQQTYQMLNEKYQNLRISEEARVSSARVVSPAEIQAKPISPNKPRNIIMSMVLASMLAFALAALIDRLDDRVHSESEAEAATGLPVLAHIPYIENKAEQSLLSNPGKNSMLLESYRMLRTNIEFASIDSPIRSIVVTSSQPNEGKSTTSTDLAIVMAMDGKKVILVDADLRRPSIHALFDIDNKTGFTSVVAGVTPLEEAVQSTSVPGLRVLSSGPIPPNPPELLNSKASRSLLKALQEQADVVIIDTPPGLVMADAQIAASIADAALLVISIKEAGKGEIARTAELLKQTKTKVLGTVLNKLTSESGGYYGCYGYNGYNKYYGQYLK